MVAAVRPTLGNMELAKLGHTRGRWSQPFPALDSPRTLVVAFAAPTADPRVLAELVKAYPTSVVIGCSTGGEIDQTRVVDDSITTAIVRFADSRVQLAHATLDSTSSEAAVAAGAALAEALRADDLRAVLVLSDGISIDHSGLVRGLNTSLPETVVVTGGFAGDGDRFARTWVLANGQPAADTVIAVGLYGERLRVTHGSRGGWDTFGPERVVTASNGSVVYAFDGRPALALYKEYLGDRAAELPSSALWYPVALRETADATNSVVRTVLGVDEATQSLTFGGDMPVGGRAKLMRANFDRLILGAQDAGSVAAIGGHEGPVLSIAISCIGRRLVLGERAEEEIEATLDALPPGTQQIGFYSYGEISPHATGRCELHNQTMTLTVLSEA
jgi:hypothetical protein